MAGLIPQSEVTVLTGVFAQHFDTFSREIVIYKEPQKVITSVNPQSSPGYYGYSQPTQEENITYVPVSGTHSAIVLYPENQDFRNLVDMKMIDLQGKVHIKVREETKNFIKNGKTEKIVIDSNDYNLNGSEKVQNYLGLKYYYFPVDRTS